MRSPWQLIKGLASRRKTEETDATPDEAAAAEPSGEELAPSQALQPELNVVPASIPDLTVEENETDRQVEPTDAETVPPPPVPQIGPSPSEQPPESAVERQDHPTPVLSAIQVAEKDPGAAIVTEGQIERRTRAPTARKAVARPAVVTIAVEQPVQAKKTVLDEAMELDREIEGLRSQLSAKLVEQNRQLRRMLERYNGR
ncbi:hypothetical protein [Rhizobium sp. BK376]|uniref:hypothetical protein n=1 Tax=Rhizobium sp. BK376 TaxID=2512149 RepID=UPI001049171D|nr:hypothetical protein [Rhizobium sp. BK376]TCR76690.1 hypothetical protein EV561_12048 [Rhizobium sp. BK376]